MIFCGRTAIQYRVIRESQSKKVVFYALTSVSQWIECQPYEPKGLRFDSQSGQMPGLQARSPVGDL